jgi:hypothetical protein
MARLQVVQAGIGRSSRGVLSKIEKRRVIRSGDRNGAMHAFTARKCALMCKAYTSGGAIRQTAAFAWPRGYQKKSQCRYRPSGAGTSPVRSLLAGAEIRAGRREAGESTRERRPPLLL